MKPIPKLRRTEMIENLKTFVNRPIVKRVATELTIAVTIVIVTTVVRHGIESALKAASEPKDEFAQIETPLEVIE